MKYLNPRRTKLLVLGAAALPLWLAGCGPKNSFAPPPPPSVTVQKPEIRDVVAEPAFAGRTAAAEAIEIRARVQGYLKEVLFEDGAEVEKGAPLFRIEPDLFEAAVAAAEARLQKAQAVLDLNETSYQRKKDAFKTSAVSELDVLAAEAERDGAKADLLLAEADLKRARIDLSYTDIRAPIAGHMSRHLISAGNLVGGMEQTLLTTLVAYKPIFIYFHIDEAALLKLQKYTRESGGHLGYKVGVELADGTVLDEPAIVNFADNVVDEATGTLTVRATYENTKGKLFSGMFVRVRVPRPVKDAMVVPPSAIQRDLNGPYVMVVGPDNMVANAYVRLGVRVAEGQIVIPATDKSGKPSLSGDDDVIVNGVQRARAGITVTVAAPPDPNVPFQLPQR